MPDTMDLPAVPTARAAGTARPAPVLLPIELANELARTMGVLSDATRLRILFVLVGGERRVLDMQKELAVPQPNLSHHLSLLRMAGMVTVRRDGKCSYYRLTHTAAAQAAVAFPVAGAAIRVDARGAMPAPAAEAK
jgi:DNA-binding transcriptional ArsR family regulator